MKNYDLIEEFLSRTTERYWDEAMLEDKNYLVPKDKICDYVRSIIRIPYRDFLSYLRDNPSTESIESKNITQCSSFVACERDMCKILERENNPGFSYEQIGQLLKDKTGSNTLDAYKKYGENQIKTSQQLGLAFEYFGDWYLSSIGYVYLMLSPTEQHSLLARTLLRDCLYAQIIKDLSTTNVDLLSYMECISSDSTKARRYGCVEFLVKMCIEECNREGTNIYSIKPRTSFQKKKDEWIVKSYSHYLPIATKINENLPIHLSRRAHIPISNDGSYKDKYISLITSVPLLTESEEKNLFLQYKGGDENAYHAICEAHLPIIFDIACKFKEISPNIDIQDLVGEGVFALCKAIELFNPTYSTRLISYAMHGIKQRMQECVDTYSSFVHLPTKQRELGEKISTSRERYFFEHQIPATAEDLASILDIPIYKIAENIWLTTEFVSLEDCDEIQYIESNEYADRKVWIESLASDIEIAFNALTSREVDILHRYFGLGRPEMELEEIGVELDLTRERVRQIKEKAVRKLKCCSRVGILHSYLGGDHFAFIETFDRGCVRGNIVLDVNPNEETQILDNVKTKNVTKNTQDKNDKINKQQKRLNIEKRLIEEEIKKKFSFSMNKKAIPNKNSERYNYICRLISENRKVGGLLEELVDIERKMLCDEPAKEKFSKVVLVHMEENLSVLEENVNLVAKRTLNELRARVEYLRNHVNNIFFDDSTFKKYCLQINNMNRNKLRGKYAPHKPILLLAITDYVEEAVGKNNEIHQILEPIPILPNLSNYYSKRWMKHVQSNIFKQSYATPLKYMESEPFYRLVPRPGKRYTGTLTAPAIDKAFLGVKLDSQLLQFIMQSETREELRKLLIAMI